MRLLHRCVAVLLCLATVPALACPPSGHDAASLQALKAAGFVVQDTSVKHRLAFDLVGCLGDPDPALRDGIAYEALATWLRAGDFDATALRELRTRLYAVLDGDPGNGFAHPFAALVLADGVAMLREPVLQALRTMP